jgi:hypothetical protein
LLTWHEYIMLVPHVRLALKKLFLDYRNIIFTLVAHMPAQLGLIFFNETQNAENRDQTHNPMLIGSLYH